MIISASGLAPLTLPPPPPPPLEEGPGELVAFLISSGEARKAWKALWYADIGGKKVTKVS